MGFVEYSVFSHAMCQKSLGCLSQTFSRAAAEQATLLFTIFVYTMVLIGLIGLFIAAWNIKK